MSQQFVEDICKILGHEAEWREIIEKTEPGPNGRPYETMTKVPRCTRCLLYDWDGKWSNLDEHFNSL